MNNETVHSSLVSMCPLSGGEPLLVGSGPSPSVIIRTKSRITPFVLKTFNVSGYSLEHHSWFVSILYWYSFFIDPVFSVPLFSRYYVLPTIEFHAVHTNLMTPVSRLLLL